MKKRHGVFPGNRASVFHEGLLPELALPVPTGVDELLVFLIGDLVQIDEKAGDPDRRDSRERVPEPDHPARDEHHIGGNFPLETKCYLPIEVRMETRCKWAWRLAEKKRSSESGLEN